MKRVTASEARRSWFRLLDEVAGGEVVVVERSGKRIEIRREREAEGSRPAPDYSAVLRAPADAEHADRWSWTWAEEEGDLTPADQGPA
jgi:hypothetical protein